MFVLSSISLYVRPPNFQKKIKKKKILRPPNFKKKFKKIYFLCPEGAILRCSCHPSNSLGRHLESR